jgi:hypothetical protein
MNSDFEKQLQRQPLRELPHEWRAEILAAARSAQPSGTSQRPNSFVAQISSWLWPYQRGWAVLAAAWIVILLLHFTAPDEPRLAGNSYAHSRQSIAIMQQQQLIMAQLLGSMENDGASPALPAAPKPRSERPRKQLVG